MGLSVLRNQYNNYIYCYSHYTMKRDKLKPEPLTTVGSRINVNKAIND